ncbi:MAG: hypothetical protein ACOX5G_00475 [Kiritimatiellia bacterium]|jgi:hypothetical protein
MELTDSQQQAVREWIAAGAGLSEVQQRLQEEFGVRMTFMDVRLMALDLGAAIQDKPEPAAPAHDAASGSIGSDAQDAGFMGEEVAPDGLGGAVSVEMDRLVLPGMLVSGSASFPDGVTARWGIDQMGRVVFQPSKEGYRPSDEDLREFQTQLRSLLERQGYA